jgi:hypothetical protein
MAVIDYAAHMAGEPANSEMRPDGSHLDEKGATRLWSTWLNDVVIDLARRPSSNGVSPG